MLVFEGLELSTTDYPPHQAPLICSCFDKDTQPFLLNLLERNTWDKLSGVLEFPDTAGYLYLHSVDHIFVVRLLSTSFYLCC